jgi:hypothetical protein
MAEKSRIIFRKSPNLARGDFFQALKSLTPKEK